MKLTNNIYLIGSGARGCQLTDSYDCNIYLLDGGTEYALVDTGLGLGVDRILFNICRHGLEPSRVRHLLLTHAHADHAGGAARLRPLLDGDVNVAASESTARVVRAGDEVGASLDVAKKAGGYPSDYVYGACPVATTLSEGMSIRVGKLTVSAIETPGHCNGHLAFLLNDDGSRSLFTGDALFADGRIQLQPIYDCDLAATVSTLRKLRTLAVDALYPGHGVFVLSEADTHIERANQALDQLRLPPQFIVS